MKHIHQWQQLHGVGARLAAHLSGRVRLLVAGQYLEHHAAARLLQHLLQHLGVVAHLLAVHLFDDVTHVEQSLLVDHAAVEDPGDHQLATFHSERHPLPTHTETVTNTLMPKWKFPQRTAGMACEQGGFLQISMCLNCRNYNVQFILFAI